MVPLANSERKMTRSAMPSAMRQPKRVAMPSSVAWTCLALRDASMEIRLRTSTQSILSPPTAMRSDRARCTSLA
ncbi:hypothetical protein D3C72_2436490 [compost metagenome]